MAHHTRQGHSLHNEGKSFDHAPTSCYEGSLAVNGAQDSRQFLAESKAAELEEFKSTLNFTNDKILVYLSLKGKMVVKDYLINGEMLSRFEQRYGEGDCLHLAKLYHRERDGRAFVEYMMKIADYDDRPQSPPDDIRDTYRFASYWVGWDAQTKERFQRPGPCIDDHVILHGALTTKGERHFISGRNPYPKFNKHMIIISHDKDDYPPETPEANEGMIIAGKHETDEPPNDRVCRRLGNSRNVYAEWGFKSKNDDPKDHDGEMIYSLQTLSRLREAVDEPTQMSPSQVSIECPLGERVPPSAVWIHMSRQEREKHVGEIERAFPPVVWKWNYGQASGSRSDSGTLSYGRDHSARMLSHRKHDA